MQLGAGEISVTQRHRVFVYGTLMRGERHHDTLAGAEFLGPGRTLPRYELVQIDYYPAMLRGGTSSVIGELYAVDGETLRRLDALEEVPTYYLRESIDLADGTRADTYVMPRDRAEGARPIPSGDFRKRAAEPR
jgi:gamma-glutamylaminecyclotransferase